MKYKRFDSHACHLMKLDFTRDFVHMVDKYIKVAAHDPKTFEEVVGYMADMMLEWNHKLGYPLQQKEKKHGRARRHPK